MTLTVAASAARAAAAAAAGLGLACAEPVVLADGANVIVRLSPSPVVAKVAASTTAVRPDVAVCLQRELDLALLLTRAGAPVLAPSPEVPARVVRADGHIMSFWTYLPPGGSGRPDEETIGAMLRDLHAVLRTCPADLPVLAPLDDIPAYLARPQSQLAAAPTAGLTARLTATDASVIAGALTRLTAELTLTAGATQVLHGDAGVGNLMTSGGEWVWHDFEDACSGPIAWDLAATTASPRLDRTRILAAYGGSPVDAAQLRICEQLRRLHLTVWYALYAERLPGCRARAAELMAGWRPPAAGLLPQSLAGPARRCVSVTQDVVELACGRSGRLSPRRLPGVRQCRLRHEVQGNLTRRDH